MGPAPALSYRWHLPSPALLAVYQQLCQQQAQLPLYNEWWYLRLMAQHLGLLVAWRGQQVCAMLPVPFQLLPLPQVYMPLYCQQLAVVGQALDDGQLAGLLQAIPSFFLRKRLSLCGQVTPAGLAHTTLVNQELDLQPPYATLKAAYSDGTRKKAKRTAAFELRPLVDLEPVARLFHDSVGSRVPGLGWRHYRRAQALLRAAQQRGCLWGRSIHAHGTGTCLGGAMLVRAASGRAYLLFSAVVSPAREAGALVVVLDQFIQQAPAMGVHTLDFEGSSLPAVHEFNRRFGALAVPYTHVWW